MMKLLVTGATQGQASHCIASSVEKDIHQMRYDFTGTERLISCEKAMHNNTLLGFPLYMSMP